MMTFTSWFVRFLHSAYTASGVMGMVHVQDAHGSVAHRHSLGVAHDFRGVRPRSCEAPAVSNEFAEARDDAFVFGREVNGDGGVRRILSRLRKSEGSWAGCVGHIVAARSRCRLSKSIWSAAMSSRFPVVYRLESPDHVVVNC